MSQNRDSNYFPVMLACGSASILLLIFGQFVGDQPLLAMLGAIAPLTYYHLVYLRPRARDQGLGQSAIDSVYYYGFLVTVAALSISALSISTAVAAQAGGTGPNVKLVVYQFGAGLLATGYAVVARMHLSTYRTILDATTPEGILDRYMKRSLELVDNAEAANAKMHAYVRLVTERTAEFDSVTRTRLERVMKETADVFESEFKATLDEARAGLTEVRNIATSMSMEQAREELARKLGGLQVAAENLTGGLDELASHARQSAQGSRDAIRTADELDASLGRLNRTVEAFAGEQGVLPRSVMALETGSVTLTNGVSALGESVSVLRQAADEVKEAAPAFQSLAKVGKKVQTQLTTLETITTRLEKSLAPLGDAGNHVGSLSVAVEGLANAVPVLTQRSTSLSSELSRTESAVQRLGNHIDGWTPRAERLTEFGGQVEAALQQVAGGVAVVIQNSRELSGTSADIARLVQGVADLAQRANGLHVALGNVEDGLSGLATRAQTADQSLASSSATLASAMRMTSEGIADDLRRSSEASRLLVDRLAQVANNIIDRTRAHQGLPT